MLYRTKRIPTRRRGDKNLQIEKGLGSGRYVPCISGRSGHLSFATRQYAKSLAVRSDCPLRRRDLLLRKYKMNPDAANDEHHKREHAALGPHRTARQPGRPMKRGIKQMSLRQKSAVRHGIKKRLRPIPRGVHSDREPYVPGPLQAERR